MDTNRRYVAMRPIGIDVGFGFTKATNGEEYVIFKSIIGEYADIQFDFY